MIYHGLEETKKTIAGKNTFLKRQKYCAVHGWIDLFVCGGVSSWEAQHGKCGNAQDGAAVNEPVKALAKAA